jgi:hypothetical protein
VYGIHTTEVTAQDENLVIIGRHPEALMVMLIMRLMFTMMKMAAAQKRYLYMNVCDVVKLEVEGKRLMVDARWLDR